MSTSNDFINYVMDSLSLLPGISAKKMFGEYAFYYKDKVVALICDNQFFLKPTVGAKNLLGNPLMAPPYKGAKDYFLVEDIEDSQFMIDLITVTYKELPEPKNKRQK